VTSVSVGDEEQLPERPRPSCRAISAQWAVVDLPPARSLDSAKEIEAEVPLGAAVTAEVGHLPSTSARRSVKLVAVATPLRVPARPATLAETEPPMGLGLLPAKPAGVERLSSGLLRSVHQAGAEAPSNSAQMAEGEWAVTASA